jgi:hypothetical protein
MANELVKWNGGSLVKSPVEKCREARTAALALLRPHELGTRPPLLAGPPDVALAKAVEMVDLPRICAVHDRPYAARYIQGTDRVFRRGPMIEVTEELYVRQYARGQRLDLPAEDIRFVEETCPWCGASGIGAVLCGGCWMEICYGKMAGRFFRCRPSCGWYGNMIWTVRRASGVMPGATNGGGWSAR